MYNDKRISVVFLTRKDPKSGLSLGRSAASSMTHCSAGITRIIDMANKCRRSVEVQYRTQLGYIYTRTTIHKEDKSTQNISSYCASGCSLCARVCI